MTSSASEPQDRAMPEHGAPTAYRRHPIMPSRSRFPQPTGYSHRSDSSTVPLSDLAPAQAPPPFSVSRARLPEIPEFLTQSFAIVVGKLRVLRVSCRCPKRALSCRKKGLLQRKDAFKITPTLATYIRAAFRHEHESGASDDRKVRPLHGREFCSDTGDDESHMELGSKRTVPGPQPDSPAACSLRYRFLSPYHSRLGERATLSTHSERLSEPQPTGAT